MRNVECVCRVTELCTGQGRGSGKGAPVFLVPTRVSQCVSISFPSLAHEVGVSEFSPSPTWWRARRSQAHPPPPSSPLWTVPAGTIMEAKGGHQVSCPVTLYLIPSRWGLLLTRAASKLLQSSFPHPPTAMGHAWLFAWVWGSELRFSCFLHLPSAETTGPNHHA